MGSKGGGGGAAGNNGISTIPAGSRKIVQSLKEIVSCSELEIYAVLKDCNMDPNEAVNRLLTQDPFREVKSKREKKKETKDTIDTKSRGGNSTSNRGARSVADRYASRGRTSVSTSSESAAMHGKPLFKKENGAHAYTGSSSFASVALGNNGIRRPASYSDSSPLENKVPSGGENDVVSGSVQPSSGFQSTWFGVPGQVSMADIVKMGRPQAKVSSATPNLPNHQHTVPPPSASAYDDFHPQAENRSSVGLKSDPVFSTTQHSPADDEWPLDEQQVPPNDEWPPFEQSHPTVPSVLEAQGESKLYADQSNLPMERSSQLLASQLDGVHLSDDGPLESNVNHIGVASISNRNIEEEDSQDDSLFDNNVYQNATTYQPHLHTYDHSEDEDDVTAVPGNMPQQLSLQKEEEGVPSEEDVPAVVIPDHLQVHTLDCQHLSFGSFGAGIGANFSGSVSSRSMKINLAEAPSVADTASVSQVDARKPEHYGDEHLGPSPSDVENVHVTSANVANYDSAPVSQSEVLQPETTEAVQGNQYTFTSSAQGYSYENSQNLNAAFSHTQTSSQMQNLALFSSVLPAYTGSLPSTLLASTVQTGRESDLPYLPFPVTQSMPTKFSNPASSISSSIISNPEAFRAGGISTAQPTAQTLPTGPAALPQHLAMHPYSQHTLPLGHFANMVSYPFLPQSYSYMPSAFQQAFAGSSTYPQSLAAVLPQYKNSLSVSSLPQSGAIASGYGFGSSNSIPGGNFALNQPAAAGAAPAGSTIGYEDALSSQYKDATHLLSLQQQNDNSAMWVHGPGSRTMPAVPASNYYNYQGQSQQPAGLRQGQQPSQHFGGALGYPNFYQSAGMSLEQQQQQQQQHQHQQHQHQQHMAGDGSLIGAHSQSQQPKQTPQLWQNTY
ncbi:hypothetical protein CDL15_Pgr001155 [Punica granatum]|uniref:GBF-interacting protein 1 N-terminal domain-containing protein n=1 Tax=Punica granatum TaxID=22663 RepID=A0A218WLC0_PUNGR|nr:hypothetical protein CDL15_Pgr001155 [Punica granatum]PKI69109.1 hypothetical protein CRG98_010578 [Punica granatum]